jgi:hypothetical protein
MACIDLRRGLLHPHTLHTGDIQEDYLAKEGETCRTDRTLHREQVLVAADQLFRYDITHTARPHAVH